MKDLDFNYMLNKLKELGANDDDFSMNGLPIEPNSLVDLDQYRSGEYTFDELLTEEEAEVIFSK